MLSLTSGTKIASYEVNKKDKFVYIQDDDKNKPPQIETTTEKKQQIFHDFLERDKKLRFSDIDILCNAYKHDMSVPPKLERKYEDAKRNVLDSLKHYLEYPKSVHLNPIITQKTYRMFISGLSGSGKSTCIATFLAHNKPRFIFLMSPVVDDAAFKKLKPEPIHVNLATYAEEYEKQFELTDFPEGSVVIMDDTDTADDAKLYQEVNVLGQIL